MWQAFKSMWALYSGLTLLWLGSGMLVSLLVLRAHAEGFSTLEMGMLQTAYQSGWIVAALFASRIILHVGHIRVFSAMAAAGSAIILLQLLYIDPWVWGFERFLMGLCVATLMIVTESWLNDMADNQNRGKVLGLYTILSWGAPVFGVWILRYNSTESAFFFLLASIFISIAVIPLLLSASRTPSFMDVERIGLKALFKITPLGVVGAFLSGACHGAFFFTVAIYGTVLNYTVEQISTLTAIALAGGIITQWPIALLSDRFDRRKVLALVAFLGGSLALGFGLFGETTLLAVYCVIGGISSMVLSLYSLCISHANDYLTPQQIVPASSTLILVYGSGMMLTPPLVSSLLAINPHTFFLSNGVLMLGLAGYVLYRMTRRAPALEQGDTLPVSTASPYASVLTAAEEWGKSVEELSEREPLHRRNAESGGCSKQV